MILLVVLIIVVALSVAAYSFSRHMLIDLAITQANIDSTQQQLLSESAVEQLLASDRQSLHQLCIPVGQLAKMSSGASEESVKLRECTGLASIQLSSTEIGYLAVLASNPCSGSRHFGLLNQSSKLNLNALAGKRLSRKQAISKLMKYKDMAEATAEGIANVLGIFDSQDDFVTNPASRKNTSQSTPTASTTSLDQLLTVPGVTEERLYGEDRNTNGVLDGNEDDGDVTWPPDNANGILDAGWSADWTLIGAESNFTSEGEKKIDLNQPDLVALYDQLCQFATPEEARFVVAWRISSPVYTDSSSIDQAANREDAVNELATSFDERLAKQLGINPANPADSSTDLSTGKEVNARSTRAGLNLAVNPARKFRSLLDLISCQLQLIIEGKDTILVSPFASDPTSLARWLPVWENRTCCVAGNFDGSRINILQASLATLTTVDGISEELAKAIIRQRESASQAGGPERATMQITSIAWLLEVGLVTTSQLRRMADEITVGGDVFQGYAIGQLQSSRTANVIFFELDGRGPKLTVRRMLDLPPLPASRRLSFRD